MRYDYLITNNSDKMGQKVVYLVLFVFKMNFLLYYREDISRQRTRRQNIQVYLELWKAV